VRSGFLFVVGIAVSNPLLFFVAVVVNSSVILTTARSGDFSMVRRHTASSPRREYSGYYREPRWGATTRTEDLITVKPGQEKFEG
jgi:hypothetical protein